MRQNIHVGSRARSGWQGVAERDRERERDGKRERRGHFLYGDRGGCPVFRVTWLNGIALAHSCPLRRDGRLASRYFFSFFLSSPPPPLPMCAGLRRIAPDLPISRARWLAFGSRKTGGGGLVFSAGEGNQLASSVLRECHAGRDRNS